MNRDGLGQVDHALGVGGVDHGGEEHAGPGIDIVGTGRVDAQVLAGGGQIFGGFGVACTVHGEHAAALTAPKGGVIEIMIEDQHIARVGL